MAVGGSLVREGSEFEEESNGDSGKDSGGGTMIRTLHKSYDFALHFRITDNLI